MTKQRRTNGPGRVVAARVGAAAALCGALAACGGRTAQPVNIVREIDVALTCAHINAELSANAARAEDLRAERVDNRVRTLSRLPGALIGNPFTAIALADPSIAIYRELNALENRNDRLNVMRDERACDAPPPDDAVIVAEVDGDAEAIGPQAPGAAEPAADETIATATVAAAPNGAAADGAATAAESGETVTAETATAETATAATETAIAEATPPPTALSGAPWATGAQALAPTSAPAPTLVAAPAPPQRPTTAEILTPNAEDVGPDAADAPPIDAQTAGATQNGG